MSKITFSIELPVKHKVVRNLQLVVEQVGELVIEGSAKVNRNSGPFDEDQYSVDVDTVNWQGVNVKPLLEAGDDVLLEQVYEAAYSHCIERFQQMKEVQL